jgi:syntaxin 16
MAQNLKVSLATRVGDSSALFRKKQSAYLRSTSCFLVWNQLSIRTDNLLQNYVRLVA